MKALLTRAVLVTCIACAGSVCAQDVLIRGANVHTMSDQGTLANADVLVRRGRIEAIGTGLSAPAGALTVAAEGRAMTPGLFGGLTAIGIEEVSLEPTTADANRGESVARRACSSLIEAKIQAMSPSPMTTRSRAVQPASEEVRVAGFIEISRFRHGIRRRKGIIARVRRLAERRL